MYFSFPFPYPLFRLPHKEYTFFQSETHSSGYIPHIYIYTFAHTLLDVVENIQIPR